MSNQPLVSVIIPTYNREKTILKAINSVLNQSYKNIEVIIVDDDSKDNTESIVMSLKNEKITYVKNRRNLGPSGARNKGITLANGSYIAFQDSDDEWLPSKLEKQMELFNKDEYGLVYCPYRYNKNNLMYQYPSSKYDLSELEGYIYDSILDTNKIGNPTMVIKKEVLDNVGGFCEELRSLEDWELALRISYKYKIGYVNEMLVNANYSLDSVNYDFRNALESYIYMVRENLPLVKDKSKLSEMISAIMRYMVGELSLSEMDIYKGKIVPSIMDDTMFGVLLHETKRSVKFKSNYEMAMSMNEISNIEGKLNAYLREKKIRTVAIYGMGRVGHQLIKILNATDIKIECVIDENNSFVDGIKAVGIKKFDQNLDAVIVTIPYEFKTIEHSILEKVKCKVLNLEYVLVHELKKD